MRRFLFALALLVGAGSAQASAIYGLPSITATGGSAARTLAARFADCANPKDFGADSTGATDVSAAFQLAYATGKAICVPPGSYGFSAPIVGGASGIQMSAVPGTVTFTALSGNVGQALFYYDNTASTYSRISGITFDGSSTTVGVNLRFFLAVHQSNFILEHNVFTNDRSGVLSLARSNYSGLRDNVFYNVGNYFKNGGPYALTVVNTFNEGGTGASGSGGNFLTGNVVSNIGGDFVDVAPQVDFKFTNNTIVGDNTGWVNLTSGAGTGAVYLFDDAGTPSTDAVISGNMIYGMTGNGIDVHCGNRVTIVGNTSNHNSGSGIALTGDADAPTCSQTDFVVSGNTAMNNFFAAAGFVNLTTSAQTTSGTTLTFTDTTGVVDGQYVKATNITVGTTVASHTSTTVTLSAAVTGTVVNGAAIRFSAQFATGPSTDSGILLGTSPSTGVSTLSRGIISGNNVSDDQTTHTQLYGIDKFGATVLSNVTISPTNIAIGNTGAALNNVTTTVSADTIVGGTLGGNASAATSTATGASAARTLAAHLGDVINVVGAGATGDGSTDDSTAINAAITAACAASPHKDVFFPNGTYLLTAAKISVTCPSIRLYGEVGATIKASTANAQTPLLLSILTQQGGPIVIEGLTFDGVGTDALCNSNKTVDITVNASWYVEFKNDTFKNSCKLMGQINGNSRYSGVHNSHFSNTSMWGKAHGTPSDALVTWNFQGTTLTGWAQARTGSAYGNYFYDNDLDTYGFDGIQALYQADFKATRNTFRPGSGNGYYAAGVGVACVFGYANWAPIITDNVCEYSSGNGLDMAGNNQMVLANNIIAYAGVNGIGISSGRLYGVVGGEVSALVVGNHILNSGQNYATSDGIQLFQGTIGTGDQNITGFSIAANDITDNQGVPTQRYGIGVGVGSPTISGGVIGINRINGNTTASIDPALAAYAAIDCSQMPALSGAISTTVNTCTTALSSFTSALLRGALTDELGTGVALFDGATPTSLTLTNATGLPIGSGVSGLGAGVASLLAGASSGTGGPAGTASPTFTGTVAEAAVSESGAYTNTTNGALAAPAVTISGTPISSGSGTTTKPLFLIEPAGTTSTGWNTNGTYLGINVASPNTNNIVDIQIAGTSKFRINSAGVPAAVAGSMNYSEQTAAAGIASNDVLYADSTAHRFKMNNNNGGADTVVGAATTDTLTNKTLTSPTINDATMGGTTNTIGGTTANITATTLQRSGNTVLLPRRFTATYDPASLPAATPREDTVTVTGVTTAGGAVMMNLPTAMPTGCVIANIYVSGADTVKVDWQNTNTVAACDVASSTAVFTQAQ